MNRITKTLAALASVTAVAGLGGGTAAAAGSCVPLGTFVGGVKVTVCVAVDTPPAGYPSVGFYVAPHGYVEVCTASGCTYRDFSFGPTGGAIVPVNQVTIAPGTGTPVPNTCVGAVCTPSTLPGYEITLFSDSGILIIQINDADTKIDLPTSCISTSGTC